MIDYTDKLNDGVNFSLLLLFLVLRECKLNCVKLQ